MSDISIAAIGTNDEGPNFLRPCGSLYPSNSPCDGTADPQYSPGYNGEGKNVASTNIYNWGCPECRMMIDDECTRLYKSVKVCIDNAYPWYASSIKVVVANCDPCVPVYLEKSRFKWLCDDMDLHYFFKVHGWEITHDDDVFNGDSFNSLVDQLKDITLDVKDYMFIEIDFHFEEELGDGTIMPQDACLQFIWLSLIHI